MRPVQPGRVGWRWSRLAGFRAQIWRLGTILGILWGLSVSVRRLTDEGQLALERSDPLLEPAVLTGQFGGPGLTLRQGRDQRAELTCQDVAEAIDQDDGALVTVKVRRRVGHLVSGCQRYPHLDPTVLVGAPAELATVGPTLDRPLADRQLSGSVLDR